MKLRAFWRYPFNSRKRKIYRDRLASTASRCAAVEPSSANSAMIGALDLWRLKLRAAFRYPFSSRKRRDWRGRALTMAPRSVRSTRRLHAELYDAWVSKVLGSYPESDFVPIAQSAPEAAEGDVKLIAYYLPQFHPIPENDAWWGKGFTEWRNVTRAYPHFVDHYQPRIPGELGYYDLRVVDVMRRQVELAQLYGIGAFCFHFYWFGGKTLLETPTRSYLDNKDLSLPFCLCWANENWSRRWDGSENEILIAQSHSAEDDVNFIQYVATYFADERYLKIDGRPVLTVYRPSMLPDAFATVQRWREEARKCGFPDLYLIATNAFGFEDYRSFGFDALSEFPPHQVRAPNIQRQFAMSEFRTGPRVRSYEDIVADEKVRIPTPGRVHPGIITSWDNSARRPGNGEIIHGSTPALFRDWLKNCVDRAGRHPAGERLIFINAWNEWAEGTYLEPDKRFGYAYLDACASVLREHAAGRVSAGSGRAIPALDGRKTVLLCSHHAGRQIFGGERSFLDMLRALKAEGFNVVVTLQETVNETYVAEVRELADDLRVFAYAQWTADAAASLDAVPHFHELMDEFRPDVVYVNTIVLLAPLVAARFRGIPTLVHAREIILQDEDLQSQIGLPGEEIVRRVKRVADVVIANSRATAECFNLAPGLIIPNTIDVELFDIENRIDDEVVFGLISSNLPKKGVLDFIELARMCLEKAPRARFRLIGPLQRPIIQALLKRSMRNPFKPANVNYPPNIEFVDYIPSSLEAVRRVNVVVNFSHFQESFGRTVLEGMAARRPAIVYNWGALPELVDHGVNGFVVGYREPAGAVEWVQRLCEDASLLAKMSEAARAFAVKNFSLPHYQKAVGDCVRHAIAAHSSTDTSPYASVKMPRLEAVKNTPIDVVVCIHNALDDVKVCMDSVLEHRGAHHRLILVDDGSGDETHAFLRELAARHDFIELQRNEKALGYTKAANIGMRMSRADFVILLNSDTVVTPLWAEKMLDAVLSRPSAGIVGPMSNAASYQSLPSVQSTARQTPINPLPPGYTPDDMNAWCESNSTAIVPSVPLVHGFCFGLTREAWSEVGEFDETGFPGGYGEENDYCFRASNCGFGLVVATHTYVYHAKSRSYSDEARVALSEAAQEVLYQRHGRRRFANAVNVLATHPALVKLRGRAKGLWTQ